MKSLRVFKLNSIIRAILICLLVTALTASLCACNSKQLRGSEGLAEKSFRDKMADASVTEITVKDQLVLESPVEITGDKVLVGEGSIHAIAKDREGDYMFVVPSGSSLTVKGSVTIDAHGLMGGIHVAQNAVWKLEENAVVTNASAGAANALVEGSFQMNGGTVSDALGSNIINKGEFALSNGMVSGSGNKCAGIVNQGKLTQNGGIVSGAYNNITVLSGASFIWNGGTNQNSVRDGVFVADGASISITSDAAKLSGAGARGIYLLGSAVIDGVTVENTNDTGLKIGKSGTLTLNGGNFSAAGYHGIENAGTMLMTGGQVFMNDNCGVVNFGTLEVTGGTIMENENKGILNKHNGKATVVSAAVMISGNRIAIGNEDTAYFELANAKIMQSTATNVYAYDGEVYIHDISLGASGSNNVRVVAADVKIEDVEIRGNSAKGTTSMHGLLLEGGAVDAKNVLISGATGSGIRNKGGNFNGENITIRDGKYYGISINAQDFTGRRGSTVIDGLVMENISTRNIAAEGAGALIITNAKLGSTNLHNIKVVADAEVVLSNVEILGTTSSAQYGVLAEGGSIELNDVSITDTLGAAIRTNRDTSKVTGKNVRICNTQTGISAALGTVNLEDFTTENVGFRNISLDGKANVTISSGDLCTTTGHNVKVSGEGTVVLNNTLIHGATEENQHGVLAEGGIAELNHVTIRNSDGSGLRTNRETSVITGKNIVIENATNAISAAKGKIEISNVTTTNVVERNVAASDASDVVLSHADLCLTVNHNIKVESSARVSLTNSIIRGATGDLDGSQYSVLAENGAVELNGVTIMNSPDAAIRINRDGSSVTGINVKIDGGVNAISANKGVIDITGLVTTNISNRNINVEGKCDVTITDGDLCMTANHNVKAADKGTLTLNSTVIRGTSGEAFGIAAETDGDVVLNNVSILDADRYALFVNNKGSSITGTNVKVENTPVAICADFARDAKEFPNDGFGTVNIDGFTTANVTDRNISVANGSKVTITNGDLCQTAIHSVKVNETAEVTLNKTVIRGVTGANQHGILAEGGDVALNDVTIQNSTGSAIRVNRASSSVNGSKVSVENAANALSLENGEIFVDGLITSGNIGRNISGTVAGKITVKNADLCKTTTHNVKVEAGIQLKLSDSTVRGVTGSSLYGILAEGGDIELNGVTVEGCTAAALRVNREASEVTGNNVTIRDSEQSVSVSAGKVVLDNSVIMIGRDKIGVHITADGAVTLNNSKVVGGKYAVINEAAFEMNGGEMFNSIWSLRNGETGTATLNGGYFYGNAEGTLPSDIHNAGTLIIDDITVGYNSDGEGSSGVIYQTANAEPIVIKGKTLGDHTHSKPMILVAEEWERLWNTKQTITHCDDLDSAFALQVNIQPGKNEPKLYVSVRGDTLELTTQPGGNYIVKIGDVRFESFADAFAYMESKGMTAATIQVVDSFDHFETVEIPAGYHITLTDDGDAHRVITNNTDGHMFTIGQNAKLTIKSTNGANPATGLEFDGAKKTDASPLYVNGGDVVIEDDLVITNAAYGVWVAGGVFEVADDAALQITSSTYALHATGGTAEINALNTSGINYTMLVNGANAEVVVNGGTFGKTVSNNVTVTLGTVKLNDVVIAGTNTHSNNIHAIYANGGDVEMNNVSISGADSAGIRLTGADSVVTVKNVTIHDCVDYGVWASAGQLDVSGELVITNAPVAFNIVNSKLTSGTNATISVDGGKKAMVADGAAQIDIAKFAASNYADSAMQVMGTADVQIDTVALGANTNANTDIIDINGAVTVKILGGEIGSAARNSVRVQNAATVTFEDVTFLKSASNNVDLRGGHTTLTDVEIQGNSTYHSVQMNGGDATMTDVTISGSVDAGIRINHVDSRLDASGLTITDCKRAISMSTGEAFLYGTNTIGSASAAIEGDAIYMTGGALSVAGTLNVTNATGRGIYIDSGAVIAKQDSKINLTNLGASGIYTVNADATFTAEESGIKMTIDGATGASLISKNGSIKFAGEELILKGVKAATNDKSNIVVWADSGSIDIANATLEATPEYNVRVDAGIVTLTNVEIIGTTAFDGITVKDNAELKVAGDLLVKNSAVNGISVVGGKFTSTAGAAVSITGGKMGMVVSGNAEVKLAGLNASGYTDSALQIIDTASVEIDTVGLGANTNVGTDIIDINGAVTVKILGGEIGPAARNSVRVQGDANVTFEDVTFLKSASNNVDLRGGHTTLANVEIRGNSSFHSVQMNGGDATMSDVTIYGATGGSDNAGIRINHADSTLQATNITITACKRGISMSAGEAFLYGTNTIGSASAAIEGDAINMTGGTITIDGSLSVSNASAYGINLTGGSIITEAGSEVTIKSVKNGINVGNAVLTANGEVTVQDATEDAMKVAHLNAEVTINEFNTENVGGRGAWIDKSKSVTINGGYLKNSGNAALLIKKGTLTLNGVTVENAKANCAVRIGDGGTTYTDPANEVKLIATDLTIKNCNVNALNLSHGTMTIDDLTVENVKGNAINMWAGAKVTVQNAALSNTGTADVVVVQDGTLNLENVTVTNASGYHGIKSAKQINAGGKLVADIYFSAAAKLNVTSALTDGSDVTVDWASGKLPADLIAVTFKDAGVMSASKQYIALGATASNDYLLYFDDAELVAKLVPFMVTTEEQLTDLIAAAEYYNMTTLTIKVGGDFAVANPVSIPAGMAVTITDDGDNTTGNTITYNGAAGSSVFDASACTEELTLSGISIDGTKKGTLLIPAGVTMNLNNVSISNAYKRGIDVYGTAKVTGILNVNTIQSASGERFGIAVQDSGRFVAVDDPNAAVITGATVNISGADNAIEAGEGGYVEIKTLNISGCARSIVLADFDSAKTNDHNTKVTIHGGEFGVTTSNSVVVPVGLVDLRNVVIKGTASSTSNLHAIFANGGDVKLEHVDITGADCAAFRITSADSVIEAKDVSISGGEYVLWQDNGTLKLSGTVTVDGTSKHAFNVGTGKVEIAGTLTITNCTGNGFHIANGSVDVLDNANISMNVDVIGINVTGSNGGFTADGAGIAVNIQSKAEAIHTGAGTIVIKGYKENGTNSVTLDGGTKNILSDGGSITVSNATLNYTTSHNVHSKGGMITLSDSNILDSGNYGVLAEGGNAELTNVVITNCNDGIRINKAASSVVATNVTVTNARRHGISVQNGQLTVNGTTISGQVQRGILIQSGGTLNISGLIRAEIYAEAARKVNVTAALTDGSDLTVDWSAGKQPADLIALTFKDADVMSASKQYIALGATAGADYLLYFDDAELVAKLVPFVVTTEEQLTDLIAAAEYYNMTTLTAKVGGDIAVANPVSIPAGMTVTITDDGDNTTGNKLSFDLEKNISAFKASGHLILDSFILDLGGDGVLKAGSGETISLKNATVQNAKSCSDRSIVSDGGVIHIEGTLTITNVNYALSAQHGGKIYGVDGSKVIVSNAIHGVVAHNDGSEIILDRYEASGYSNTAVYTRDTAKVKLNYVVLGAPSTSNDIVNVAGTSELTINGGSLTNASGKGHNILEIGGTPIVTLKDVTLTCYTTNNINIQSTSNDAKLTLDNVTIIGSGTQTDQHGIYMKGATVTVLNTLTIKNVSGGAIRQAGGIVDATASGAKIVIDGTGNSAIYNYGGTLRANDLGIKNNLTVTATKTPQDDIIYIETNAVVELGNAKLGNTASGSIAEVKGNAKLIIKGAVTADAANLKIGGTLTVESTGSLSKTDGTAVAITNEGTVNLAGKVVANVTGKVIQVSGTLKEGSKLVMDWTSAPTTAVIRFTDAAATAANRAFITLGATQTSAGNYLAYNTADFAAYVKAPVQAADSAALAAALANASANENTVILLTGTETYQVSNLAVGAKEVTITSSNNAVVKTTLTAAGEMTSLTAGGKLTLDGVTLDGNSKVGYVTVPAGAVLNVKNVTFQNLGAKSSRSIDVNGGKMHMSGNVVINSANYALAVQENGTITSDAASKLTISNATYGVVLHGANTSIQIADLETIKVVNENVYIDNAAGKVTINKANLAVPTNSTNHHSIIVKKGALTLNNATINGTTNGYGIFVETANSKLYGDNIYITGTSTTGLEVRSGYVEVSDLTMSGLKGSHSMKLSGTANVTITGATFAKTNSNNINVDGGSLTLKGNIAINGTSNNNGIRLNAKTTLIVDGTLEIKDVKNYGIFAEGSGTVKVQGKLNTTLHFNTASSLNVTGALADGSTLTVDWASGLAPNPAITFASDDVMHASKPYITLGAVQATNKELYFADAKATLADKQ